MKLILTLSLTVALSIVSFIWDGFGRSSFHGLVSDSEQKLALPDKQLLADTQGQASNWLHQLGLPRRWVWFRLRRLSIAEVPKQQTKGIEQQAFTGPWWSGLSMLPVRIQKSDSKMDPAQEQQPVDTEHQASNWPCWLGLSTCPRRVRYRVGKVVRAEVPKQQTKGTEQKAFTGPWWSGLSMLPVRIQKSVSKMDPAQEQQPVDTEHQASNWPCWLGLSTCPRRVRYRVGKVVRAEVPKQQTKGTEQKAFTGPWWSGLSMLPVRIQKSDSKMDPAQEQQPVDTEHQASNWPCWLGLSTCPRRVRYRVGRVITAKGLKQEPLGMAKKSFSLPYPLDLLWDYTARHTLASFITGALVVIFIECLLWIAHRLWR